MRQNILITTIIALLFVVALGVVTYTSGGMGMTERTASAPTGGMGEMGADAPAVPLVMGFAEGERIFFLHTEASSPQVAEMLERMMGSPVLVVPALGDVAEVALAPVYVFTNGVTGDGPFGFQPDVFPAPPGDPGYTPLRAVHLVTWKDPQAARVLTSAAEVQQALTEGAITIEQPGAVVNMPFVTWPGGHR